MALSFSGFALRVTHTDCIPPAEQWFLRRSFSYYLTFLDGSIYIYILVVYIYLRPIGLASGFALNEPFGLYIIFFFFQEARQKCI